MNVLLSPSSPCGQVKAIASKSDAHRKLICSAFSEKAVTLHHVQMSDDISATVSCLRALGSRIEAEGDDLLIHPVENIPECPVLDCGESGSTLRFLLPVTAAVTHRAAFTGRGALPCRPLSQLIDAMSVCGVSFSAPQLPFEINGKLKGGRITIPGNISSQYISGLLMALNLVGEGEIELTTPPVSAPYVNLTISVMERFGVRVEQNDNVFAVHGGQKYSSPGHMDIDGDWSNAAVFLACGAMGNGISVAGLDPCSPQGDKAIIGYLRRFGAEITVSNDLVIASGGALHGCDIDITHTPDLLPVLAVVACSANGTSRFCGVRRLRYKESDRAYATADMINSLGGHAVLDGDVLAVRGTPLSGGIVSSFNDHRIVMAASLASCVCGGTVTITDAQSVNKSYPGFFEDFKSVGGKADVL